ncbi:HAD family phosphatase [Planomonospora sp. ID82291]|uniref:HAD family hydrolase n=1 Tax=Planomonospora sp. ID82291 TaxID=2738136 RepID=UPI0018C38851|nr:HAD family phosphatase [Planomonospora sp. ID82291]MBG0818872.1 HAD family phosphatase [Planomonospora sp. ID82291]
MNPAPEPVTATVAATIAGRRAWLFDLDGTLVDSAPAHEAAFRTALAETAPDLLDSFDYTAHAGTSTRQVMQGLGLRPDLARRAAERKQELYRAYAADGAVAVLPGARRLLGLLADLGRIPYLVTSGSRDSVTRVLTACALTGSFRAVLTADDAPWSKPDPRFYRQACHRWAVDPADALAVEDSAHGVASATGAGLLTLQVHGAEPAPGAVTVQNLDAIVALLDTETPGMEVNPRG